jgi:glycine reductase complex component B subunit gamma
MGVAPLRTVHYVNQFFGGIGGEEHADLAVEVRPGPIGPGRGLEQQWNGAAHIMATIIGGDNFVASNSDEASVAIRAALSEFRPDVVVAGPAFNAGRYGLACGLVCRLANEARIPSVTAMSRENPALSVHGKRLYIVATGDLASSMPKALPPLARLALKLGRHETLGSAHAEGYLPRGIRRDVWHTDTAAQRAIAILKKRLSNEPFSSEMPIEQFEPVAPAPPLQSLLRARVAVVSTGGIVPKGNPDRLREYNSVVWKRYSIADMQRLDAGEWEPIHGGYDSTWAREDPNRVVPLDALRALERERVFASLHDYYYVTVGVGTAVNNARRFGEEIAKELRAADVQGVILTAT